MEVFYILLFVIILQFVYIVYQDWSNRQEREKMALKIMAKDAVEYSGLVEKPAKNTEEEDDVSVDIDDVDTQTLIEAKDKL